MILAHTTTPHATASAETYETVDAHVCNFRHDIVALPNNEVSDRVDYMKDALATIASAAIAARILTAAKAYVVLEEVTIDVCVNVTTSTSLTVVSPSK